MPQFQLHQEVAPGDVKDVTVEADSEDEAKAKARAEHGGVTVGEITSDAAGGVQETEVPEDAEDADTDEDGDEDDEAKK